MGANASDQERCKLWRRPSYPGLSLVIGLWRGHKAKKRQSPTQRSGSDVTQMLVDSNTRNSGVYEIRKLAMHGVQQAQNRNIQRLDDKLEHNWWKNDKTMLALCHRMLSCRIENVFRRSS